MDRINYNYGSCPILLCTVCGKLINRRAYGSAFGMCSSCAIREMEKKQNG